MNHPLIESRCPLAEAVAIVGSQVKLAVVLEESQQTISNWLKYGIPADKRHSVAMKLERVTHGRVTRKCVCADDWQEMWPELADQGPSPDAGARVEELP
ncbi:helix-turn-helix domain-containing protein [Imbroritus primus]|uniref:Helix-turn-helix domain-containing protein n=1 Tax=Imbroritus primus TaxID=3058603 RepID=A0ACD3SR96_9BURK|nr:helix-turn-helix domain-containing protein [Burkholderiaceae bacterium PBA]